MTDGQSDIFNLIFTRAYPRNQIITPTQYGKSDIVSMALVLRSETFNEPWAIVAGQQDKARIIMGRVIQHTFDHPRFYKKLELDKNMPLDRLRRERSKDNITWAEGGGIRTFTANTRNRQAVTSALTGHGAPNIIEDEAALVPDDVQAMIMRMLGGHKDNFLLKIGNPFYRNHFYRSSLSGKYHHVFIDYKQALLEGRYDEEFIEEMREMMFFDILYECKFPPRDSYTSDGYRALISDELLEGAWITEEEARSEKMFEEQPVRMGIDIGGGGDRTAYVLRWPRVMKLVSTNTMADTMQQVPIVSEYIDTFGVEPEYVSLDYGGLGQGVSDRLLEMGVEINKVMFGESAPEDDRQKYQNMRAYMYYQFWQWLKNGGKIIKDDAFLELLSVNFRQNSERRFAIQPKEELKRVMHKMGINATSPDVADAAALTFVDGNMTNVGITFV